MICRRSNRWSVVVAGLVAFTAIAVPSVRASTTAPPQAGVTPPGKVFPYAMHQRALPNGLRVVVVPTGARGMFALYEVVGTGSRDEVEPGHSGFAHFFEHMMFKGTKKLPAEARVRLLGSLGVDESGYTTNDFTTYHMQGPSEALPRMLEVEADRFQNLSYDVDTFKVESRAVLGEYNKSFSNPDRKADEALADLAFDTHTYKHTTMGFLRDIEKMPERYTYAQRFFQRFYTPDNVLLIVAGDVDPAAVFGAVEASFGPWRGKRQPTNVVDEPGLKAERRGQVPWKNPTLLRLHVGWRVPSSVRDPKAGALSMVLKTYLFSESSALWKRVVLDDQLAENVSTWWDPQRDASLFSAYARVKDDKNADVVLAHIQSAFDGLAAGKVDAARFDAVRKNLRYSLLMGLTSADNVAGALAYAAGPGLDPGAIDALYGALDALTPADLSAFAAAHFGKDQRAIITVAADAAAKSAAGAP